MHAATIVTEYLRQFHQLNQAQSSPKKHAHLQQQGIDYLVKQGFPTRSDEDWRFTDLRAVTQKPFKVASPSPNSSSTFSVGHIDPFTNTSGIRIVFVNGYLQEGLSSLDTCPDCIRIQRFDDAWNEHGKIFEKRLGHYANPEINPFVALNTALFQEGLFIYVKENGILDEPIHLIFINDASDQTILPIRLLFVMEPYSRMTLVESHIANKKTAYWSSVVNEIILSEHAHMDHYKLQYESPRAQHLSHTHIDQGFRSIYRSHIFLFGGQLTRNQIESTLHSEEAKCTLNGLYMGKERQIMDTHTKITHAQANCNSHELYKGILDQQSCGIFHGMIHVLPEAQKTDAVQTNRALLLSEQAKVNSSPQLKIFADDVRCTHGATIAQLDKDALFYFKSRGLDRQSARQLLSYAFANEVIKTIGLDSIRQCIDRIVTEFFDAVPSSLKQTSKHDID